MTAGQWGQVSGLGLLAIIYFVIAVIRSSYAELNPVAAARLLGAHGLHPRVGEAPSDIPPLMRTTFDLIHHMVLLASAALCFAALSMAGFPRPFLLGGALLAGAMAFLQILARGLAVADPEAAFSASLVAGVIFYQALRPLVAPVAWAMRRLRQAAKARRRAAGEEEASQEEIEAFIDAGQKEGILEADEGRLIRQVVEFHDSIVREVMTARTEVVALPTGTTMAQARETFAKERHSRLPVYRDQIDNVVGILTLKDLVASLGQFPQTAPVDSLLRPAYFVPETKQVADLLKELQTKRIQMAIVVDEYGGTAGVVTVEDLLEQLVGDIKEEHEREEPPVVREEEGRYSASGTASLDDLRAAVGIDLEIEGVETVSGLIYSILGRIPREGESVEASGLKLEVIKADRRKIDRVRVTRLVETRAR